MNNSTLTNHPDINELIEIIRDQNTKIRYSLQHRIQQTV